MLTQKNRLLPDGQLSAMLNQVEIPRMATVRQLFTADELNASTIKYELESQLSTISCQDIGNMKVAIAVGSRGINNLQCIIKTVVSHLLSLGAHPFIVPAMGSHGGATATGQVQVLEGLGITESNVGCPIASSMDTIQIGKTMKGDPVFVDKNARNADGLILICRIKPHTDFRGPYESGIMKMLTVGLGKQKGADIFHSMDVNEASQNLLEMGTMILSKLNVFCAVAVIENAFHRTYHLEVVPRAGIEKREPELLEMARKQMPRIYFPECDVLIVDQIGKDISGTGMDPNITGTFSNPYVDGGIRAKNIVILDLTEESHGNGIGIGMGSITTQICVKKINFENMYMNCLTAGNMLEGKIPAIMGNDRDAIRLAIKLCKDKNKDTVEVIRIHNTLEVDLIYISEGLMENARQHPFLKIVKEPCEMVFDGNGDLVR